MEKKTTIGIKTKKTKCGCPCHKNKNIKHIMPCCDAGWIEMPISLNNKNIKK